MSRCGIEGDSVTASRIGLRRGVFVLHLLDGFVVLFVIIRIDESSDERSSLRRAFLRRDSRSVIWPSRIVTSQIPVIMPNCIQGRKVWWNRLILCCQISPYSLFVL